jgi:hypothetical protein
LPERELSWLGRVEWGAVFTTLAGGGATLWRWLVNRKRREERLEESKEDARVRREAALDESKIETLTRSWKLQEDIVKLMESRFQAQREELAALGAKFEKLESEHAACERTTRQLSQQNQEQAQQIESMRREIESLRQQINQPRLRAV